MAKMDIPKYLVMDVDGTLTDGKIYMGSFGEAFKAFSIKDGYILARIEKEYGIIPVIITGRISQIVENRCKELGIKHIYQGVSNKLSFLKEFLMKQNGSLEESACIGDDLNDLDCIKACGYSACPADAVDEVKNDVGYICKNKGGDGVVREYLDFILGRPEELLI